MNSELYLPYSLFKISPPYINHRSYYLPGRKNGKWDWLLVSYRCHDRDKFDDFKTRYYNFEGWDPNTGWPKPNTLQSLELSYVADELEARGRLGS